MTFKYLNFFEKTAEIFINPEKTLKSVKEKNEAKKGVYFLIFYSAFLGLIFGTVLGGAIGNPLLVLVFAIFAIICALIKIFIWTLITHIVSKVFFDGEGELGRFFGLMGYSAAPYILLIIGITSIAFGKAIIASLIMFLLALIWIIFIGIIATESEQKIGYGKSFLSCMGIPSLLVIIVFFIMGVL
ncbi:YIP1 family protein [Methanobacterium alcaliphilum]|uniref:YIP1 family protein n=1 Tax=Methanobacterium alcaliphilum TaxID=392018 RepID=UPI00200AA95A|nr:YIP1 family protein [Methanobacterium alcaliphilum]MCK9151590.1 YIP1 family protein [Methanobacterium alcaliphilum]